MSLERLIDNIYFDSSIENPSTATGPIQAKFRTTRDSAIVDRASDFYFTIARTDIPVNQIPITNWSDNVASITLSYNGNDYQQFIQYEREDFSDLSKQNVFQYQNIVDMINTAFSNAFTTLKAAHAGAPPDEPPHMVLLPNNRGIGIRYQLEYDPSHVSPNPTVEVSCNIAALTYFQNLPGIYYSDSNPAALNGKNYQLKVFQTGNNLVPEYTSAGLPPAPPTPIGPDAQYIQMNQHYPTFYMWYDFSKLVIVSNSLPVNSESIGVNESGVNKKLSILTDFKPDQFGQGDQTESNLVYSPQPQYRLIDMYSNGDIREIDYNVFWQDTRGRLNQLLLFPGQSLTIKLLFVRKSLYHNNWKMEN